MRPDEENEQAIRGRVDGRLLSLVAARTPETLIQQNRATRTGRCASSIKNCAMKFSRIDSDAQPGRLRVHRTGKIAGHTVVTCVR